MTSPGEKPLVAVLGPFSGGTSCVAGALARLGVFMGDEYELTGEYARLTYEAIDLARLLREAFTQPAGERKMEMETLERRLEEWSALQRSRAPEEACMVGGKHPLLCLAVSLLTRAWRPVRFIRVIRPLDSVVRSLELRRWWPHRDLRSYIARMIEARDVALRATEHLTVDYDRLVEHPAESLTEVADYLGLQPDPSEWQAANRFVSAKLRRVSS